VGAICSVKRIENGDDIDNQRQERFLELPTSLTGLSSTSMTSLLASEFSESYGCKQSPH
jgi:hypothetical protein